MLSQAITNFHDNLARIRRADYNETEVRVQFINPLFEALGWDMGDTSGRHEVRHEDRIHISGKAKAPDYGFYLDGRRKFFVEAKKPAVNLDKRAEPAYQLRRYAWTAKLPLSVLTDFEEFAVYDTRVRPAVGDSPKVARLGYWTYDQYLDAWDDIAAVFSREAVLAGSLDVWAAAEGGKKGVAPVDAEFLKEIEHWRDLLARNIALRNPTLDERGLNFAVQQTIDRLLFLRIAEDRGIEPYGRLRDLSTGGDIYSRLFLLFNQADARYNSGLFHFGHERGRGDPDMLTPALHIDDKALRDILKSLYEPVSPYEFSVFPADILGHVYEQFLGKVIRLAGKSAKVEEKPEVRKAGGVYYTPTYIVDYIVRQTVGKLLDGHAADPGGPVSRLRVLDPACGSGSFLLGAYQYLLDWHLQGYLAAPSKWSKGRNRTLYQTAAGEYHLTLAERKRILLDNLYGVDIDPQAVEVTKLSLLLKVLEGTPDALGGQLALLPERVLPDLGDNIKCGNSLIGPDFYVQPTLDLTGLGKPVRSGDPLTDEAMLRINAFDWRAEFRDVMEAGGFDAVIGNPPYIFTRNRGIDSDQKDYYYSHYNHQSSQLNSFGIFVEKSHYLLQKMGTLGFITPNNWLTIDSFTPLRRFILDNSGKVQIYNILDRVFAAANVDTAILVFSKTEPGTLQIGEISEKEISFVDTVVLTDIRPPSYIIQISLLKNKSDRGLLEKIESVTQDLRTISTVSTGLKVYQTGKGKPPQGDKQKKIRSFHARTQVDDTYGPYLQGVDVVRYRLSWSGEYLSYGDWVAEPRKSVPFNGPRLLIRQIPSKPPYLVHGVHTDDPYYNDINSMVVFSPTEQYSLLYLLGLINSRLISFWFQKSYDKLQRKIFPQFKVKELGSFPIRTVDPTNPTDKANHDQMVALVERMLDLHKRHAAEANPQMKTMLHRQIDATDKQIDALVYALYGLTEAEIGIVENQT
ncbi:MAG: N-6 DNA methylase [Candidatus Promineofilum sp.]|nr:N-6 DNA methylase [Promineifilum sp.]